MLTHNQRYTLPGISVSMKHVSFILNNGKLSPRLAPVYVALEVINPKKNPFNFGSVVGVVGLL